MRFNPPPNWPPAPPGWVPDANWQPDPSWPPAPPGWQLWVPDTTTDAAGAQFPPYATPWPEPAAPPASRKRLWIGLGAAAVVVALAGGLLVTFGRNGAEGPSHKRDITDLTSEMLVERTAFPDSSGGKWISGVNNSASREASVPGLTIDPPECADMFGANGATQTGAATLSKRQREAVGSMRVQLAIAPERRDLKGYLRKCESYTQTFEAAGHTVSTELHLKPLDVAGLPSWAVASMMTSSTKQSIVKPMSLTAATIAGYYRGVLVTASDNEIRRGAGRDTIDTATAEELLKLFNAQIEKLEAAP